jgi:ribosome-binding factor A
VGRVSELVRLHLCDLLETKVDDPRLLGVTITEVEVTPDTTRAKVYFSVLGDAEARQAVQEGLESAAGWLRREIGARTRLRNTPALVFHWDPSLEHGERIDQLLNQLGLGKKDSDEAV